MSRSNARLWRGVRVSHATNASLAGPKKDTHMHIRAPLGGRTMMMLATCLVEYVQFVHAPGVIVLIACVTECQTNIHTLTTVRAIMLLTASLSERNLFVESAYENWEIY